MSSQQEQQRQNLKLTHKSNSCEKQKQQSQYLTALQIAKSFPRVKYYYSKIYCCQLLPVATKFHLTF